MAVVAAAAKVKRSGWLAIAWRELRRQKLVMFAATVITIEVILAILAPVVAPFDPEEANPTNTLAAPGWPHVLGTDVSGMDIFSRLIWAPRIDLTIAVASAALALSVGAPLGVVTGYFRGLGSEALARMSDLFQAFPLFVLAMLMVVATGQNIVNVIYVLAFLTAPIYLRLVRTQTYFVKERLFVEASKCAGMSPIRILWDHLLPNSLPPALVQLSVNMGFAMLLTAGLSFIGAGVRVPTPEWGSMISVGAPSIVNGQWWPALFPGLALGLTVFSFAVLGDFLERLLDPRRR